MELEEKMEMYVIRHAQSLFNLADEKRYAENKTIFDVIFNPELIDCGITPLGYEQTKAAAQKLKNINIKVVVVSPLRRALLTATEVFKNHPSDPRFIAMPILREQCNATCDLPDDLDKIKQEFPHVDFSEMDAFQHKKMWILESLVNTTLRKDLTKQALEALKKAEDKGRTFQEFIAKALKDMYPATLESSKDMKERSIMAKKLLKERFKDFREGEIALVAHYEFLNRFTASKFDKEDPIDGEYFANCQVLKYKF